MVYISHEGESPTNKKMGALDFYGMREIPDPTPAKLLLDKQMVAQKQKAGKGKGGGDELFAYSKNGLNKHSAVNWSMTDLDQTQNPGIAKNRNIDLPQNTKIEK